MHDKYQEAFTNIKATKVFKDQIINKMQEESSEKKFMFNKKGWRVATFVIAFIILSGSIVYAMEVIKLKKLNQNYMKMDDEKGILITQTYSMDFPEMDDEKIDDEKIFDESDNLVEAINYENIDVETAIEQENLTVVLPDIESLGWKQEKFQVSKMPDEPITTILEIWYKTSINKEIFYSINRIEIPQEVNVTHQYGIQYGPENVENTREYTTTKGVKYVLFDSKKNQKTYTNVAFGIKESISENYYYFISFCGMEEKEILEVLDTLDFGIYHKE